MIHIFIGTKAQLIKMAPIMVELQERGVDYNFIFSGQHRQTFDELLANFNLKQPDCVLYDGKDITGIFQMLCWGGKLVVKCMLNKKLVWRGDKNGVVLNHGDTFSTLLGTLLAKMSGLKSAHIESGLRSFSLFHPFPEEITRLCVFRLSDYLFCPNLWAMNNVNKYSGIKVNSEANTLVDSLRIYRHSGTKVSGLVIPAVDYGVVSLHRFENIFNADQFSKIITLLEMACEKSLLLFILHKPTEKKLHEFGLIDRLKNNKKIELRQRYDYFDFIELVSSAKFVITDGGSNQEECHYLGKPCLIMRSKSERTEGLNHNAVISNFDPSIVKAFLDDYSQYNKAPLELDFKPSERIVDRLVNDGFN